MIDYIIIAVISYLIGALPWAYFITKLFTGKDIHKNGTGNVGAMNSYDVTQKKHIFLFVLILDCLKGILSVLISLIFSNENFYGVLIASFFVVLGHNYNIFMKFKGGRGLAAAAGVSIAVNPLMLILWLLCWVFTFYFVKKNVHIANYIATVFYPIILTVIPANFVTSLSYFSGAGKPEILLISALTSVLIVFRHIKPIQELLTQNPK